MRLGLLLLTLAALGPTAATADDARPVDFNRNIRPILSDNCFACHGPDEAARQAELRLDTKDGLFRARDGVTVVRPGKSAESELIHRVTSTDEFVVMPPADSNRQLTPQEIDRLRRWVEAGAPWEQHWSLVPPRRPVPPTVTRKDWPRNPIDVFLLARLQREGLAPSPEASQETLIRRVTLDLTGLPPTPDEVDAFLADESPDAYDRLVDRLLASPRYGERMVWDWLDAARYADSNGYQADPERTMWPWRDWVVRAMNENMPYDQFTVEQLAGDLLPNATTEQIIATGFNRNHMYNGEGGRIPEETRVENVMDRVETTATVWLGLTLTCCRCHDHKYDPLSAREYYRLYAFFNNTSEEGARYGSGQVPPVVEYVTPDDEARRAALQQHVREAAEIVAATEDSLIPREAGPPPAGSSGGSGLPEKVAAAVLGAPEHRSVQELAALAAFYREKEYARAQQYVKQVEALKRAVEERDRFEQGIPDVMVMDVRSQPRETFILQRGAYDKPGEKVTAGVPAVLPPLPEDAPYDRLALARWLVDSEHPLTARVTVNRYWQTFFGTGLVKTPEDFGAQGERPSHPQLLDWLAVEFVASGWDVKRLHRLIVTSAAYRQSSKVTPPLLERDPDNRLLARGPRFRRPSWMLRDQALAVSGLLVERTGGPPVRPYQPPGVWEEATFGKKRYVQDHGGKLYRRSLYTFWRRIIAPTMFFDTASRQTCTVKATRTNTPLHALILLNEITFVEAARALAQRVLTQDHDTPAARIASAFRRVTSRRPKSDELAVLLARLDVLKEQFAADPEAAAKFLQVGESPRNEGLDPVEHAAYAALCSLILNLDETLTKQ